MEPGAGTRSCHAWRRLGTLRSPSTCLGTDGTGPHRRTSRLQTCVDRVCGVLDTLPEPAILVGHSRGGLVISQAAESRPQKIKALIYLAAYLIPNGEAMLPTAISDTESLIVPNLTLNEAQGWHMLKAEAFKEALYADCPAEDVALAQTLLTPEPNAPVATPLELSEANFGRVPRIYITCLADRGLSPA